MISLFENIQNSFESIWANKLRASLSMLWIIIWVSSVIILTAIWNGSQAEIVSKVEEMGTNILTISPARSFGWAWSRSTATNILNAKMVQALWWVSGISSILPVISSNGQAVFWSTSTSVSLLWVDKNYFTGKNINIIYGSNFSARNIENLEKVIILWQTVVSELFWEENPVGKRLKIGNNVFEVIWIIESNSTLNTSAFIPLTTSSVRVTWQKYYSEIIVVAEESTQINIIESALDIELQKFLWLTASSTLPYRILNQSEMLENLSSITQTLTMLLSWIAAISLLVWGIWVMNIMLVSVTERTKEIGIRKAIGATKADVLIQFMTESSVLSILGWTLWIALSYWVVFLLHIFSIAAVISFDSIVMSFCFSLMIWIVFWLLPAYKASKLKPIDALRFE